MSSTIVIRTRKIRNMAVAALAAAMVVTESPLPAQGPSAGEEALIWLRTKMHGRQYRRNMRNAAIMDAFLSQAKPVPEIWNREHQSHRRRLAQFIERLRDAPRCDTIAFGDSLLDLTRTRLHSVPERLNFSISGTWAHHMAQMAADIHPALKRAGFSRSVRYVVIGSLGGNPLLMRQPVDVTITQSYAALDVIRRLYPGARIIVFGIPPTVSFYVNTNAIAFEAALCQWVLADRDAVFLPLQRHFAGLLGLFPKAVMSVDGVHFSDRGTVEFDKLIEKAKRAPSKSIVD